MIQSCHLKPKQKGRTRSSKQGSYFCGGLGWRSSSTKNRGARYRTEIDMRFDSSMKWFALLRLISVSLLIIIDFGEKLQEVLEVCTGCPNKKETGTNMPVSLKLDKHLNIFGHRLLESYLLFPTVPRNVGSVMSVNEHEHFKDRLTIWVCTKMLKLRLAPSLWYFQTFFQIVDLSGTGRPRNWWANLFPTFCKLPVRCHSVTVKTLKCTGISNLLAQ